MATQTITCKADNYVSFTYPSDYHNNGPLAMVSGVMTGYYSTIGLFQFDVPQLTNKVITKAELKIHCSEKGISSVISATQYNIPASVNTINGSIFKSDYFGSAMSDSPTQISSPVYVNNADEWVTWDLTSIISNSLGLDNFAVVIHDIQTNGSNDYYTWIFSTIETGNAAYIVITYNDAVPDQPTILYPSGDVIEKENDLTFQWRHNSLYDTGQVKYDFGWRQQGNASWIDSLGVVSTIQSRTLDTNTLPTGIIEWRVRTYNANNAVSEYAYGSFELTGRPTAPIIDTMKNDAITEIAWRSNASETAIFRVWIYQGITLVHDSGNMPGGLTSTYVPNMMFPNGQYTVKMRIGSVYGIWSDESAKVFNISASIPPNPNITLSSAHGGILIVTDSTAVDKIVYRSEDGVTFVPIDRFDGLTYTDYAVKSETMYEYFIRAHNGSFSDSEKRSMKIKYKGSLLSNINTPEDYVELYKSDSNWFNSINTKHSNEAELVKYEGRTYPVKESGTHKETRISTSFFLKNTDAIRIETIYGLNKIYLFRNSEVCIPCEISELNFENALFNTGKNVELSLTQVDYDLGVRFDV